MQDTHIELSADELNVISDTDFFILKRNIIHKLERSLALLGEHTDELLQKHRSKLPAGILAITPKISRGERYLELPWLILDYPRIFSDEDIFAFRSMFWWGKHFSFTVHLSGKYLEHVKRKLSDNISTLHKKEFYLCINKDPWQHHFEKSNFRLLDELTAKETTALIEDAKFIKLGRKLPLNSFSKMIDYGVETYKEFTELLY